MTKPQIMGRLVRLVGPLWGVMALAIAAGIAGHLAAIAVPTLGVVAALSAAGVAGLPAYTGVVCAFAVAAVARGILHYLEQIANHYIAFKLLARIRHQVFAALRRLAPAKLSGRGAGDLISVITGDIELLEVFYAHTISPIVIALGVSVAVIALEFALHPVFGAIAAVAFAVVGIVAPVVAGRASGASGKSFRDELGSLDAFAARRTELCPHMATKTSCNRCATHCYPPARQEQIRAVMRYAGPRMLLHHPIAAIRHLLGR